MATTSQRIIEYYNQTDISYRLIWGIDRNLSIHYGYYDDFHKSHDSALVNMNRVLADSAKITLKDNVLDAGCGIGGSSIWIAENIGAQVTGININNIQVERAKRIAKKRNVNNLVKFYVKDYMETNFQPESFTVVWTLESLCYSQDKKKFLVEAKRVLSKNGRLVVAGFFLKDNLAHDENEEIKKWLDGWVIPNLETINRFQQHLEDLGFKNIQFRNITENIKPSSKRIYLVSLLSRPIGRFLEFIGYPKQLFIRNTIASYYQHKTLLKDLWAYGIFCAEKGNC